jgi:ubiquinone/menaquinone biosynthesis C-methylase UbiE
MPWLMARVYDRIMAGSEAACLARWRRELLAELHGRVLEVGAGTGASIPCYPESVNELILAEPDPHMRRLLEARLGAQDRVTVIADSIEALSCPDASFDAVVCSLVLCSVASAPRALDELSRVLRPGGALVFIEHVAADADDEPRRLRWQHRLEPVWKRVAGNCHLTRDTERAILEAGFEIEQIERESLLEAMPLIRPSIRGVARKLA